MEAKVRILNRLGLHARPASLIAQAAGKFAGTVSLTREDGQSADAKSILSLLMLGAPCGTELTLTVESGDETSEAETLQLISKIFADKFEED